MISHHITHDPTNSMTNQLGASAIAGFCAAFFSLPFDMLKSRLREYLFHSFSPIWQWILTLSGDIIYRKWWNEVQRCGACLRFDSKVGRTVGVLDWIWSVLRQMCTALDDNTPYIWENIPYLQELLRKSALVMLLLVGSNTIRLVRFVASERG